MNKEGETVLKVGYLAECTPKVFKVEENEQVISIKAFTVQAESNPLHGSLINLKFKIAKFI